MAEPPASAAVQARRSALLRGAAAEARVADAMEARGWTVRARNWSGAGGELDLVATKGPRLRIVEVKLRDPEDPGGFDAIDRHKRRRIARAAEAWLLEDGGTYEELSFSVALIEGDHLTWLDDAFDVGG